MRGADPGPRTCTRVLGRVRDVADQAKPITGANHLSAEFGETLVHLGTLFAMKAAGKVGHIGITTSHRRRHAARADHARVTRSISCSPPTTSLASASISAPGSGSSAFFHPS